MLFYFVMLLPYNYYEMKNIRNTYRKRVPTAPSGLQTEALVILKRPHSPLHYAAILRASLAIFNTYSRSSM